MRRLGSSVQQSVLLKLNFFITATDVWNPLDGLVAKSCPTLCDPIDSSPPGSPVPGILQARIQEWVSISFSNA